MATDLNNKSLEQLQKEKLQGEIDILHARLASEYPEEKTPGFFDKLAEFARKWSAFVLGSVTLISAIFGVFVPLSEYLDASRRALSYDLNENMIGFVNDLSSDSAELANRGIMMLSYYEMNSIPILLFYLEGSSNFQKPFRTKIIETIDLIYSRSSGGEIEELIVGNMQKNLQKLKEFDINGESKINSNSLRILYNYMDLIKGIKFSDRDLEKINANLSEMKTIFCSDEFLKEDFEAQILFYAICEYIGVEANCN
jgi:hypothetical protein